MLEIVYKMFIVGLAIVCLDLFACMTFLTYDEPKSFRFLTWLGEEMIALPKRLYRIWHTIGQLRRLKKHQRKPNDCRYLLDHMVVPTALANRDRLIEIARAHPKMLLDLAAIDSDARLQLALTLPGRRAELLRSFSNLTDCGPITRFPELALDTLAVAIPSKYEDVPMHQEMLEWFVRQFPDQARELINLRPHITLRDEFLLEFAKNHPEHGGLVVERLSPQVTFELLKELLEVCPGVAEDMVFLFPDYGTALAQAVPTAFQLSDRTLPRAVVSPDKKGNLPRPAA